VHLLLRRGTRVGVFHRAIYVLDIQAQLSDEEQEVVARHGLAQCGLYRRSELVEPGRGIAGLIYRLDYRARNLTITSGDLIVGRRVEAADLAEILALEDLITRAARTFSMLVRAAADFSGDEVIEL
jgi:hypothetical protein